MSIRRTQLLSCTTLSSLHVLLDTRTGPVDPDLDWAVFYEGQRVEAKHSGKSKWFGGTIMKVWRL